MEETVDQHFKKTWANKLELGKKFHSLRLNERGSVQEHIQLMAELFCGLAKIDSPSGGQNGIPWPVCQNHFVFWLLPWKPA